MVIKATPQTILHIQPSKKRNAVTSCRNATEVLVSMSFCFVESLNRILAPHSTVRPHTNVPGKHKIRLQYTLYNGPRYKLGFVCFDA